VCSWEIDGSGISHEKLSKILFSDKTDKQFFSVFVENGHFIKDGANQFYDYLVQKGVSAEELKEKMAQPQVKILEDLIVDFANLPEDTCA
jgi:hypothetical protein